MTDITIADQCEIDKYEDIMINVFYYLFSYNYNLGLFTDDSSVYDMKYLALENQDYKDIANDFEKINKEEFDYFEAEKEYNKILNNFFINKITNVFKEKYNYSFTKEKHLLKTIGKELKNLHPNKAWKEENIFLIKRLNHQQKQLKLIEQEEPKTNVIKFPKRKKLTKEEIKKSTNFLLMMKELDMSYKEAKKLSDLNLKEKMKDKKFKPYIPKD